jgi:hypothetical protein
MKETLELLNQMKSEGILTDYAVGGAVASIFYIEPVTTYDLDVFVILTDESKGLLTVMNPIFEWLKSKGYEFVGEHMLIEGIPVQFIPAYNELVRKAVENASTLNYDNVSVRVIAPEYLIAIMLQVSRKKDTERARRFFEEYEVDETKLQIILEDNELLERYNNLKNKK